MLKALAKAALRPAWSRVRARVDAIVNQRTQALAAELAEARAAINGLEHALQVHMGHTALMRRSLYVPNPLDEPLDASTPFLAYSNCQASDFFHPRYAEICQRMGQQPLMHRKQWEWVFVVHKLIESGVLRPGARGLVFGVGTEPLPAVFASMGVNITATDAPPELADLSNWRGTNQQSAGVEQLLHPHITPDDVVRARVTHRACDMNHIDADLTGYDFNWSSCCFEHLGTLELGLQFVINAVEQTLKVGGVAVHTTEYNVSSNDATVSEGDTVIYRRRDMDELIARLRQRGHQVDPFLIGPTAHALDFHVDVPPYLQNPHLKLLLMDYVATSVGLVVRCGKQSTCVQ